MLRSWRSTLPSLMFGLFGTPPATTAQTQSYVSPAPMISRTALQNTMEVPIRCLGLWRSSRAILIPVCVSIRMAGPANGPFRLFICFINLRLTDPSVRLCSSIANTIRCRTIRSWTCNAHWKIFRSIQHYIGSLRYPVTMNMHSHIGTLPTVNRETQRF